MLAYECHMRLSSPPHMQHTQLPRRLRTSQTLLTVNPSYHEERSVLLMKSC